jgi:hypothetical protein
MTFLSSAAEESQSDALVSGLRALIQSDEEEKEKSHMPVM